MHFETGYEIFYQHLWKLQINIFRKSTSKISILVGKNKQVCFPPMVLPKH